MAKSRKRRSSKKTLAGGLPGGATTVVDAMATNSETAVARLLRESLDRVDWVIEQMADQCLEVAEPGQPFAGRDRIIQLVREHYAARDIDGSLTGLLEEPLAAELVDAAQMQLWSGDKKDDAHVQKRFAIQRYKLLRRIIIAAIDKPRVEKRFEIERPERTPANPNPAPIKLLVKTKEIEGVDPVMIRLLVIVESHMNNLMGLDQVDEGSDSFTLQLFNILNQKGGPQVVDEVPTNLRAPTQTVRQMQPREFSPRVIETMRKMIDQVVTLDGTSSAKPVAARVLPELAASSVSSAAPGGGG